MPEFICIRKCHFMKVWNVGEVYMGEDCPNRHFKPMAEYTAPAAHLEPSNPSEVAVFNMRPAECVIFIKQKYGEDIDTRKSDYPQEALRIMRNKPHLKNSQVPTENRELPEALTKAQYKDKIEKENPGIQIPPTAMRSMKSLKNFEATLKTKEDFMT
jgi:hypothetical protein